MAYIESKYKVSVDRNMKRGPRKPWRASLYMYGRQVQLGNYVTQEEALLVEAKERQRYRQEKNLAT